MSPVKVSVVITTKNEGLVIARLLQSLKKQSHKNLEVIVVDNNSTDQTKKKAEKSTKLIFNKGPERSAQRNFGLKKSKGKYVLFLDADMQLSRDVVKECVQLCERQGADAVVIPERSVATNFWERVKAFERSFYNQKGDPITDAARFYKKSLLRKLKGYDRSITGPEDWDLPDRVREAGYKISRAKSRILHFERIPSLYSLLKKKYYYGLGSYRYLKKHKLSPLGPKTVYFLRPVFYRQWRKMVRSPGMSLPMLAMFVSEMLAGGLGFLTAKLKDS